MKIGVDAMGGDFAPGVVIEGLAQALVDFPEIETRIRFSPFAPVAGYGSGVRFHR